MQPDGVLLTGFGGPDCPDAVGPFMRNLTGHEPDESVVERVRARYERIGGCSPMTATAMQLARQVEQALAAMGRPAPAAVGMRYWAPTIDEAVAELVSRGCRCIAHVSLSPLESAVTHERYREAVRSAVSSVAGLAACEAPPLAELEAYRRLHAEAVRAALATLGDVRPLVAFSAHSLPISEGSADDAYVAQFRAVCEAVAMMLEMPVGRPIVVGRAEAWGCLDGDVPWVACYQSRGLRGSQWLGPDLHEIVALAEALACPAVVVAPVGFALDHMETLYDIDIEARSAAEAAGLTFIRTSVPNADPALAAGIAGAVSALGCGEG